MQYRDKLVMTLDKIKKERASCALLDFTILLYLVACLGNDYISLVRVGTDKRAAHCDSFVPFLPPTRECLQLLPYFYLFYATRLSKQGHVERERRGGLRSIPPLSRSPQLEKAVGDRPQTGRQYRGLPTLAAASGVLTAT